MSYFTRNSVLVNSFLSLIVAIYFFIRSYLYLFPYVKSKTNNKKKKYFPISGPLSVYNDTLYEYQIDSVLIYVDVEALGVEESEKRANEDLNTIMYDDNIKKAMSIAEDKSKEEYPNEWKSHYRSGVEESPLELRSVDYDPKSREFRYKFYFNNSYPELKEGFQFSDGELLAIVDSDEIEDLSRICNKVE